LHRLIGEDLLEQLSHRGVRVRKLTLQEIIDVTIVATYLHGLAVRLLAESRDPTILNELKDIIKEDEKAVADQNFPLHFSLMDSFYNLIVQGSRSRALIKSVEALTAVSHSAQFIWPYRLGMSYFSKASSTLLETIIFGDADRAEAIMRTISRELLDLLSNSHTRNTDTKQPVKHTIEIDLTSIY